MMDWETTVDDTYDHHHLCLCMKNEQGSMLATCQFFLLFPLFLALLRIGIKHMRRRRRVFIGTTITTHCTCVCARTCVRVRRKNENKMVSIVERMARKGWSRHAVLREESKSVLNGTHAKTRLSFFRSDGHLLWDDQRVENISCTRPSKAFVFLSLSLLVLVSLLLDNQIDRHISK